VKHLANVIAAIIAIIPLSAASIVHADAVPATPSATGHVIINEVKLGGTNTTPEEYVTLFNAGTTAVTLDQWKLEYAKTGAAVTCPGAGWSVPSSQITTLSGTLEPDQLSAPITRSLTDSKGGALHLVDAGGTVQDLVGWGSTASPSPCSEQAAAQIPTTGKSILRYLSCADSFPVDSDNNASDFTAPSAPNPTGLSGQYAASCQSDSNPAPVSPGSSGSTDISGDTSPSGPTCEGVLVNEILPNPAGTDTGHEFIELHNPTVAAISLDGCALQTSNSTKLYNFSGISLAAGEYHAFYDDQTGLTLPNAAGGTAFLLTPTEEIQSITYPANLGDDVAWAKFSDTWESTYTPTPNAANALQSEASCPTGQERDPTTDRCKIPVTPDTLVPCKPGQERNPDTNRCRSILAAGATLTPCKPGQERNPATNRCKAISSTGTSSLTPCKAGQVRNPVTNRCKSAASSSSTLKACKAGQVRNPATNRCKAAGSGSTLKPCTAGQVRNPLTNRCRKSTTAGIANVADVKSQSTAGAANWRWLMGIVIVTGALAYAAYEWRQEFANRYATTMLYLTKRLDKFKLKLKRQSQ
jgi:hypothetical protein